jgi:Ca2+-binding EF-hand superfamily protein
MTSRSIFVATVISSTLISVSVFAGATFNSSQFLGIDRNADNQVSAIEAEAYRIRYFTTLDLNGDGRVEFDEYVEAHKLKSNSSNTNASVPPTAEYKEADVNKDRELSLNELLAVGKARFAQLDTDKNGLISQKEFVAPGL